MTRAVPEQGLGPGDVGTVMAVHQGGAGYTVEFVNLAGDTVAILTLTADALRAVADDEVPNARTLGPRAA